MGKPPITLNAIVTSCAIPSTLFLLTVYHPLPFFLWYPSSDIQFVLTNFFLSSPLALLLTNVIGKSGKAGNTKAEAEREFQNSRDSDSEEIVWFLDS